MTIYSKPSVMRIVVLPVQGAKPETYSIQVVDGDRVVHSEQAEGISQRDRLIWQLADLYDVPDVVLDPSLNPIAAEVSSELQEFKFSEIPSIPVLQEDEAEAFFESNQRIIYDRMIQAVAEAVSVNRSFIRLFELNGTGVYLTSQRGAWKAGLNQAMEYFLSKEDYERCGTIKQLLAKV